MKRSLYTVGPPADDAILSARLHGRSHRLWVGGPVPKGSDAITLGSVIIVRRSLVDLPSFDELLRHEQVHVAQFREQGVAAFVLGYVKSYVYWRLRGYSHWGAYRRIPHEIEARWIAGQRTHAIEPARAVDVAR